MKNSQNIIIVLLVVAAMILAAVLVGSYTSEKAYADTMSKQGDYIMTTFKFSDSRDLVSVIDISTRRMNTYAANINGNTIDLVDDNVDLERAFGE